jgi:hypothetical protein
MITPNAEIYRARLLALFHGASDGLTDFEAQSLTLQRWPKIVNGETITTISDRVCPRRNELVKMGYVQDSGRRRENPSTGIRCIVWELVPPDKKPHPAPPIPTPPTLANYVDEDDGERFDMRKFLNMPPREQL